MHHLIIIPCFLLLLQSSSSSLDDDPNHISINCGGAPASTSLSGRRWSGDAASKLRGSSTAVKGELITAVDPVPYSTARISRSQFSYSFHLTTPGQKFIRFHFNPVSNNGFESFNDLFTVEAGPFTLLANFSASITARALSLNVVVKEFCIIVQQNQPLNILFSPETRNSYAFVNGIEIISLPSTINYCHGGDTGVDVLGQKSVIYIDNDTVLERVYQQNIKWGSVSFGDDIGCMFGEWESILQGNANIKANTYNLSCGVSVDVGFWYLVRVHLCEVGLKMDFMLMIDNIVALTSAHMLQQSENRTLLWYNYMVMVKGKKREGNKHRISISMHYQHELVDRQGPLEGFEVFKLSNQDLSLATPNPPLPPTQYSPPHYYIPTLLNSLLGRANAIATLVFTMICLVNIILHLLQKMWGTEFSEEENEPSARPKQPCRRFTLAEIQSATENFHSGYFIGKGGFGNVYKGFIDNRREMVAIKRLKPDSNQGEQQFWTEVKMLSELRHVNLVSLLGFCIEKQEMMLVYEFMPCGTLADHLFKLAQKSHDYIPLSWKQRLKICIGAGRALDYLHTGHGIIHRDVKSSNILLDEKFVAKVSDFGLAKPGFCSESQSQNSTLVKGTHGYLDPNYCETHKPTKKSDTYSFGVVLLEVLCGRRALERHSEEDKCRLTTWAIDNISKGHIDQIVLPSLIGEISPDSLKTFVKVAKRCLHDEPKKRPAIGRVVMKLELALQQQEKAESSEPNEMTNVEDWFSTTAKYQKEKMKFTVPNEKINIVDTLPQMEKAKSSGQNEIRNVTDAMPCADNDRTMPRPVASSSNPQTVTSLPSEQTNSSLINYGRESGRKSMMLRISRKLWPWDAIWKTRKASNKTNLVGTSVSAPISHMTGNITLDGNTITNKRNDGMILIPEAESSNRKEQHSQTMRVMDNIRNGQADHIVAPTLRGKISPDSLRKFINIAESWLHEEPKNRPTTMHIVTEIELALQQEEAAEPLPSKDGTTVEGVSSSTGASQKENMNSMAPNEKTNVTDDASPSLGGKMLPHSNLRDFTFAELKAATRNFRNDLVLGEGGFGTVYKGFLDEKGSGKTTHIAVKKLNSESMQGFEEWKSEVDFLGTFSHPNLVRLFGYCYEDRELLLVYEFMPNGSLESHLFGRAVSVQPLPWDIRLKILIGAARGLAFLHAREVIHRDVKASNILLDESYHAKISDFGLAKLGPTSGTSHVTTRIIGTYGYTAPEYIATGHLYVKSDVYGFGVVLLEMLTGMQAYDTRRPAGEKNMIDWMKPLLSNLRMVKGIMVMDAHLKGQYPTKSALKMTKLVSSCLESEPRKRPSMQEIVETLERIASSKNKFKNREIRNEIRNVTDAMLCADNDRTMPRPVASSSNPQTVTSLPFEQINSTLINYGRESGRKSMMLRISQKLWPWDAFWKNRKPSNKTNLVGTSVSVAVALETTTTSTMMSSSTMREFSLAELKAATRNFRKDSVLGEGGFGKVYKGWLDDKASSKTTIIAVKKLNSESMQGFQEWKSEVNFLGRLSHPNLVKLLGYGWEDKELLLVYEFMPKGSLENHLFGKGASVQPLPWDIRLKILIGAARGMAFLHASAETVIYRDFKASNILLDGSYQAKISDFGLAKMGPTETRSHVTTTHVMGTYGYAAPEYVATGHLYVKSDVYGFGVVVLEMLTGQRAFDTNRPSGQHSIGDWIKPHLSDRSKLEHIIDVRLEGRYPSKSALHIAQLALTCLENDPRNRPSMQKIVETLERIGSSTERSR